MLHPSDGHEGTGKPQGLAQLSLTELLAVLRHRLLLTPG